MRPFVRIGVVALALAGCHQPEEPPPVTPKPIDPVNVHRMGTGTSERQMATVIDASIVSEDSQSLDGRTFELEVGAPRRALSQR